jgi:hypothetical protein
VKKVFWAAHARYAAQKRSITLPWVEETLGSPDWTEPDRQYADRIRAFRRFQAFGDRVLRVVYEEDEQSLTVVTVMWDRKAGRRT